MRATAPTGSIAVGAEVLQKANELHGAVIAQDLQDADAQAHGHEAVMVGPDEPAVGAEGLAVEIFGRDDQGSQLELTQRDQDQSFVVDVADLNDGTTSK